MLDKSRSQWVNWRREPVNGKITKVPYQPNGYKASSTKSDTWSTYEAVSAARADFDGIGIIFDGSILGVDIDHILVAGTIQDKASRDFVDESNTYTEISPSGDGLHLFFKLSEPFSPVSNKHKPSEAIGYECYSQGRYFTVTENIFEDRSTMRTIDAIEAERLLKLLGYPWKKMANSEQMDRIGLREDKILETMFRASNGVKAKALYEGDISLYNKDESAADMAFCNMLAFYSGKRPDVMERLWLSSPLGKREKVQQRKDYRDATIRHAIEYTSEVFGGDKSADGVDAYITKKTKNGEVILLCTENVQTFLNHINEFQFRFDEFKQNIEIKRNGVWKSLSDADTLQIQSVVSRRHPAFGMVTKQMIFDAVQSNAYMHSFDSVKDYFNSLRWDGTPRIDSFLTKAYNTPDDEYHRAVGSNWLKGIAHRAMVPGCKFDYVLVLEGPQGSRKSMSLAALAAPWHAETTLNPDNKDFFMILLGNLIVEFAEGETISRAEVKKLKATITVQEDVIRLPYERTVSRLKRRCVFAMTTNEDHYLKDDTGNRRWLPVHIGERIDVEWITANRDQLFAEAFHRVITLKEPTWEFPVEETEAAQAQRRMVDPRVETIDEWYVNKNDAERNLGITTREVFDVLDGQNHASAFYKPREMNRSDEMQISSILKEHLKLVSRREMINGVYKTRYFPTQKTPKYMEPIPVTLNGLVF